jgi:hypothetical protein
VAPVENIIAQRPSLLPAACTSVPGVRVSAEPATVRHESLVVPMLAGVRASLPQVHQVQVQAELAQVLPTVDGSYGTNGFRGSKGIVSADKPMTEGARGVPPRGRPV